MRNVKKANQFYIGMIILLIISIRIFNNTIFASKIFNSMAIGKFSFYSIFIVIPATIGLLIVFNNRKSIIGIILSVLGILMWISALIACISLSYSTFGAVEILLNLFLCILGLFFTIKSFLKEKEI